MTMYLLLRSLNIGPFGLKVTVMAVMAAAVMAVVAMAMVERPHFLLYCLSCALRHFPYLPCGVDHVEPTEPKEAKAYTVSN